MVTPVLFKDILPSLSLQGYIRKYQIFRFVFEKDVVPPVKFHAPRAEHSITFYVRDAQKFSYYGSADVVTYPSCIINGIYTVPILRHGSNDFWAIKAILQPTALFQLVKTDMQELTNCFINAEEVWGHEVSTVCEQLHELDDLSGMIRVIEAYLGSKLKAAVRTHLPFDKAICSLVNLDDAVSLDWLASQSCLSIRQFIRKFEEHIGLCAKTYQRIARFEKAFRMKNTHPYLDWLSIAVACGYHDYQHLAKDFKEFTHLTPPAFYEVEKKSPERSFGLHES